MAEIVLGLASSHGTALQIPPADWKTHADISALRPELIWYRGERYPSDDLARIAQRAARRLRARSSPRTSSPACGLSRRWLDPSDRASPSEFDRALRSIRADTLTVQVTNFRSFS